MAFDLRVGVPLTTNSDVKFNESATLVAWHVNLPACCAVTESILSTELRLPNFTVVIPEYSLTGRPLKYHLKSMGRSPDVTKHCTLAESPKFDGLSPKLKWAIDGGTECLIYMVQNRKRMMEMDQQNTKQMRIKCEWLNEMKGKKILSKM